MAFAVAVMMALLGAWMVYVAINHAAKDYSDITNPGVLGVGVIGLMLLGGGALLALLTYGG